MKRVLKAIHPWALVVSVVGAVALVAITDGAERIAWVGVTAIQGVMLATWMQRP